jgi:hypothetical protein
VDPAERGHADGGADLPAIVLAGGGGADGFQVVMADLLGVAAGVAAGGVVAYGVGDYVHNYIEDFGQQWHQHGVLGIGGAAKSVWHGITSLC